MGVTRARATALLALALALACQSPIDLPPDPDPLVVASEDGARRALAYLSSTIELVTIDVVISMMVYAEVTGDPLAASQAERRLRLVPEAAITAFGPALGEHPAHEASALPELEFDPDDIPDPQMTLDDRDQTCPLAALSCESVAECDEYLALDLWGYPLTHQALTLVFAQWGGCENEDLVQRQRIGGRLLHAQRTDPGPSDLSSERMAMLGQLGFAGAIDDVWIDDLLRSQAADGAFYWEEGDDPHPHPTGVALWALASWRRAQ